MNRPKPVNVVQLGQVFTPPAVVSKMLALRRNNGRTLEPSAGNGAFSNAIPEIVAIELDPAVAPAGSRVGDFFAYSENEKFLTVIGNPPYVRYQDIRPETKKLLKGDLFDYRSNLYLFFIEKAIRHLNPGGELIFIVPREFVRLTAARKLNEWLYAEGTITDFIETGDSRLFANATPNCAIFRFERGLFDRKMHDGRTFTLVDGQLMFLTGSYPVPLAELFQVRVGAVSGSDRLFTHPEGDTEFVCSETARTGRTRRMFFETRHEHLIQNKDALMARRIRKFNESNWWQWGRLHHISEAPRIYVNQKTRSDNPFFHYPCLNYDGSVLALFPHDIEMDIGQAVLLLNTCVDWDELGFVCDGRFVFGQRTLQTCLLPDKFRTLQARDNK